MMFVEWGQVWLCLLGAHLRMRAALYSEREKEGEKQKANTLFLCDCDKLSGVLTGSPLGPIIPG